MSNLDVLKKFIKSLSDDKREDRYKVRAEIIEKCEELIKDHEECPDYNVDLAYLHSQILHEAVDCSNTGHSASMFYHECANLLLETRGIPKGASLESLAKDLIEASKNVELPSSLRTKLDALAAWF